jgi:uncharacterized peroxidase-related enzyme
VRLVVLEKKHPLGKQFKLGLMGLIVRGDSPLDVVKMLWHRPEFFGGPFVRLVQTVLRGPSEWTVGERELFAAFTSNLNTCPFCAMSHSAVASALIGDPTVASVLQDFRGAPVDPKVRAVLAFLEKMTRSPGSLQAADGDALRAAGISEAAIEDAIYVGFLFNVINRLANAFDFHVASPAAFAKMAPILIKRGYPE